MRAWAPVMTGIDRSFPENESDAFAKHTLMRPFQTREITAESRNHYRETTMTSAYDETYARSMDDPEGFWGEAAEAIHWYKRWDKVLDDTNPPFYRWFTGAETNTCYNALAPQKA